MTSDDYYKELVMIRIFRSGAKRFRLIAFMLALITAGALTFSVLAVNKRRLSNTTSPVSSAVTEAPISSAQSSASEPRGQAQIVHFTLYDVGIFPHEERASPGLVAIYVNDLSGGAQGLVVESESGQKVGQVNRRQGRDRWRSRIALGQGRYQIYDASRPKYRATLIVEPD
jgi:hypothetical protein